MQLDLEDRAGAELVIEPARALKRRRLDELSLSTKKNLVCSPSSETRTARLSCPEIVSLILSLPDTTGCAGAARSLERRRQAVLDLAPKLVELALQLLDLALQLLDPGVLLGRRRKRQR